MIEIVVYKNCFTIMIMNLNVKTKIELLDACSIKNCTAKMISDYAIEVKGTQSDLYNLLVEFFNVLFGAD